MAKVSFVAFLLMWNDHINRKTPDCHIRIANWLEHKRDTAVLRCHRGIGKSTILPCYNAWRYYCDPATQILHQSESDSTAYKISRATQSILRRHPLTDGILPQGNKNVERWWVNGADETDPLHSSMVAKGIMSNVTGGRATEVQNDDVEVPRNITTPELRGKLRDRLGEQTHILVPGGTELYVGTPHTYDSLYDELIANGADHLTIKLFAQEKRLELKNTDGVYFYIGFKPDMVFTGISGATQLLEENVNYKYDNGYIELAKPFDGIIDFYAGVSWPERFTRDDILKRRSRTKTLNAWDSQYQLHSKPVTESRLDPSKIRLYDVEPTIIEANREVTMMLGNTRIIGATAVWDPSLGKLKSDASPFTLLLTDTKGHLYWHVAQGLTGDLAVFGQNDQIIGGQVIQICELVKKYGIPSVVIETNGIGGFAPNLLRQAFKSRGIRCGVIENHETRNKQIRILEALEAPLQSRFLWAHVSVADEDNNPALTQMRDFNPDVKEQPDDYIDSLAGAVLRTPIRIAKSVQNRTDSSSKIAKWRPDSGHIKAKIKY
ncbi:phage terminase large subunit [Orbaceae bacterium ESL0721]|nr:phage terminase large subunit [Orbaceae bacterium ESL0721]